MVEPPSVKTNDNLHLVPRTTFGKPILEFDFPQMLVGVAEYDGDILFAATTNQVENPSLNDFGLSYVASELAWDAVLSSFLEDDTR